jgi:restriction system protein
MPVPAPEFPGNTAPRYRSGFLSYLHPLLVALRDKGGQARPREIYDAIADRYRISPEERAVMLESGTPRVENQIAWARSYLYQTGYMDSPKFGIWRLTEKGRAANLDGPAIDEIYESVQKLKTLKKAEKVEGEASLAAIGAPNQEGEQEESIAPSPETSAFSDHRPALIDLIRRMSSAGFERFCSELLSRVGVEAVQTTRQSRDGGIDGTGQLRVNEFVTMPVAFQSKKYDQSGRKVSPEEIQRFRGAMHGNIAKGIFFTTTSFTEEARREAKSPGKVEVELVDLERILEICERYQIGLSEQQILIPQPEFFEAFFS